MSLGAPQHYLHVLMILLEFISLKFQLRQVNLLLLQSNKNFHEIALKGALIMNLSKFIKMIHHG